MQILKVIMFIVFNKEVVGKWCLKVRDSMDFTVSISYESDTIFCNYTNVLYGGKYLNSFTDSEDFAFKIPAMKFLDTTPIEALNYYNSDTVKLRFQYDSTNEILKWNLLETDAEKSFLLPKAVELHKCK